MRKPWHISWGQILEFDDSPAFSIELLTRLVAEKPRHAPAWRRLGVMLTRVSRFEEAAAALRKALRLAEPENRLWVYCDLGDMHRDRGSDAAAARWFRRAIDEFPDDTQGYIYLGGLLARRGRLAEAEAVHRRGTLCTAGHVDEAYLNLGFVLRAQGRYADAARCFDSAIELDPDYEIAHAAKRDVERAIELQNTSAT